jgi:hypothetical protein
MSFDVSPLQPEEAHAVMRRREQAMIEREPVGVGLMLTASSRRSRLRIEG